MPGFYPTPAETTWLFEEIHPIATRQAQRWDLDPMLDAEDVASQAQLLLLARGTRPLPGCEDLAPMAKARLEWFAGALLLNPKELLSRAWKRMKRFDSLHASQSVAPSSEHAGDSFFDLPDPQHGPGQLAILRELDEMLRARLERACDPSNTKDQRKHRLRTVRNDHGLRSVVQEFHATAQRRSCYGGAFSIAATWIGEDFAREPFAATTDPDRLQLDREGVLHGYARVPWPSWGRPARMLARIEWGQDDAASAARTVPFVPRIASESVGEAELEFEVEVEVEEELGAPQRDILIPATLLRLVLVTHGAS